MAIDHNGNLIIDKAVEENKLDDYVGKDLANKLINTQPGGDSNIRRLEGLDIKVGGEGMQGYYDKIVPQVANDVIKQLGGKNKVKVIKFGGDRRSYEEIQDMLKDFNKYPENSAERKALREEQKTAPDYGQHEHRGDQLGFEITPEMIKFIKEDAGIPKFKKGGSIDLQQEYNLENMRRRYG